LVIVCYKNNKGQEAVLKKTDFGNLWADLILLLGFVGLFPTLNDFNVIPQLQPFHLNYMEPGNKQNELKVITKWLRDELTKYHIPFGHYNMRLQTSKPVPRDLNNASTCILL
jgi:hypothetical protein